MVVSSSAVKMMFNNNKYISVVYGQKGHGKNDHHRSVGEVLISNPTSVQQPQ